MAEMSSFQKKIETLASEYMKTRSNGYRPDTFVLGPYQLTVLAAGFAVKREGQEVPWHKTLETGRDGSSVTIKEMAQELARIELTYYP